MSEPVTAVSARDERRHEHDPDELLWSESYYLDFVAPDRGIAGYVRIGILPNLGRSWYWACVVGPDRPLVTIIDHDVPLPRTPTGVDIRYDGLWSSYIVETPIEHVSVGLEGFGVALDDPTETYRSLRGDRIPLGFDLEWETDGGTYVYPGVDRYEVPSRVIGEVLVGDETFRVDCLGQRDHSWGSRDWWSIAWSWTSGWLDDGTRFHATAVDLDGAHVYGTGYVQPPGAPMAGTDVTVHTEETDAEGLPTSGTWRIADLDLRVEPVAFAPVLLTAPDGRISRFPRAWTRFTAADGRTGHGWTEWNQPMG